MSVIECRKGEPLDEAARRVATDALYAARDNGGTMHDAGVAAGDAVSSLYAGAVASFAVIRDALDDLEHAPFRAQALADLPDIIRAAIEGQ